MYKQVEPWYKRKAQTSFENWLTLILSNIPFNSRVTLSDLCRREGSIRKQTTFRDAANGFPIK